MFPGVLYFARGPVRGDIGKGCALYFLLGSEAKNGSKRMNRIARTMAQWRVLVLLSVFVLAVGSVYYVAQDLQGSSGEPPPLTAAEKALAKDAAKKDPGVVNRLAGRAFLVEVGPSAEDTQGQPAPWTGAAVTFFVQAGTEYFQEFLVTVDVTNGRVKAIYDLAKKPLPPGLKPD